MPKARNCQLPVHPLREGLQPVTADQQQNLKGIKFCFCDHQNYNITYFQTAFFVTNVKGNKIKFTKQNMTVDC